MKLPKPPKNKTKPKLSQATRKGMGFGRKPTFPKGTRMLAGGTRGLAASELDTIPANAVLIDVEWGQSNKVVSGTTAQNTTPSATHLLCRARSLTSTAWSRAGGILTITVGTDHKCVPGMVATFNTQTALGDMPIPTPVLSVTSTTVSFNDGGANGSATETANNSLVFPGDPCPLVEGVTESMLSAKAAKISALDPGRIIIGINEAVGGSPFSAINQGTVPYNRMIASIQAAIAYCVANEIPYEISLFGGHGEQDNQNGMSAATYQGLLEEFIADVEADLGEEVWCFITQQQNWPKSGTGVTTTRGEVALGQLAAAFANPRIVLVAGLAQVPFQTSGNNIHINELGAQRMGEIEGVAWYQTRVVGQKWEPLHIANAAADGSTIILDYEGGDGSALAIDNTNVTARLNSAGLYYTDGSGTPPGIVSVALGPGTRQLTVELSHAHAADGVIESAYRAAYNVNLGSSISTSQAPGTNIRDSSDEPSIVEVARPLRIYAATERRPLDSSTNAGSSARAAWANTNSLRSPAVNGSWLCSHEWGYLDGATSFAISWLHRRDTSWPSGLILFEKNDSQNGRLISVRGSTSGRGQAFVATNDTTFMNYLTPNSVMVGNAWQWNMLWCDLAGGVGNAKLLWWVETAGVLTEVTAGGTLGTYSATPPNALPSPRPSPLGIMAGSGGASNFINGNLRDLAFWRNPGAAVQAEIEALAPSGNGGVVQDPALAAWGTPGHHYRFESDFCDYGSEAPLHLTAYGPGMTINSANP